MGFFRDVALLKRAMGAVIVLALGGLWAWKWREDLMSDGLYNTDTYLWANDLVRISLGLAIVATIYVAVCLLLTPRPATKPASSPADGR